MKRGRKWRDVKQQTAACKKGVILIANHTWTQEKAMVGVAALVDVKRIN